MEDGEVRKILAAQRRELTEHVIYERFAGMTDGRNRDVLRQLAEAELEHYRQLQKETGRDVSPSRTEVRAFCLLSRIFGLTFGLKLMERRNRRLQGGGLPRRARGAGGTDTAGNEEEQKLLSLLNEERLEYVGAIILGLNDALVELTGALAGLTFALQGTRLVAMSGLITGIAAALSMGGTGYLAAKSEENGKPPLKSALYTGLTYVVTVAVLITPYLVFENIYLALGVMLFNAVLIILVFNFYVAVAKDVSFVSRFAEMALLSMGIAALSFGIGYLVRVFLGVEV